MPDFPNIVAAPYLPIQSTLSEDGEGLLRIIWTTSATAPASAVWPTANRANFYPLLLRQPFYLQKFWVLNGATASNSWDMGIYAKDPGVNTGTKIASTGGTAQSGTNVIQSAAPSGGAMWLPAGSYYLALAMNGTSGTFFRKNVGTAGQAMQLTAYTLPATCTLAAVASEYTAVCGILDGSTI